MPPTITGVFTIRNAIDAGYPFAEAVLSALPIVDEFLINDGGSDDGTREVLEQFRDQYPKTITLFDIPDFKSDDWEVIDAHLHELIDAAAGDWLLEVQADEIWHEDDVAAVRELVADVDAEGYNSIRQPRYNYHGFGFREGRTYRTVRLVRNHPDLRSYDGGDNFQLGAQTHDLPHDYSNNYVPPEYEATIPIYHFPWAFDAQQGEQYRRSAEWLATANYIRQDRYDKYKSRTDETND